MKKPTLVFCFLISLILLGCVVSEVESNETATDSPAATPVAIDVSVASAEPKTTAEPAILATPAPTDTPAPTATPSSTPIPTREPREGDITIHFPDYDTGVDADYSYQSDELRIAITVVEDTEELQKYYVADIWVRSIYSFRAGFGNGKFNSGPEEGESFAQREHAILAVNGSMNIGIIYHNGQKIRGYMEDVANPGIAVIYQDGSMKVFERTEFSMREAEKKGVRHIWQFGPTLVSDGKMVRDFPTRATRHPRVIIGYYEPGHYCLVAVDGRSKTAIGMTDREMAELMLELGCQEAMNLDGGNSAMMVFMGKCISHPSGADKDNDGKADRRLKDMVLFAEYDEEGNAPALDDVDAEKVRMP